MYPYYLSYLPPAVLGSVYHKRRSISLFFLFYTSHLEVIIPACRGFTCCFVIKSFGSGKGFLYFHYDLKYHNHVNTHKFCPTGPSLLRVYSPVVCSTLTLRSLSKWWKLGLLFIFRLESYRDATLSIYSRSSSYFRHSTSHVTVSESPGSGYKGCACGKVTWSEASWPPRPPPPTFESDLGTSTTLVSNFGLRVFIARGAEFHGTTSASHSWRTPLVKSNTSRCPIESSPSLVRVYSPVQAAQVYVSQCGYLALTVASGIFKK